MTLLKVYGDGSTMPILTATSVVIFIDSGNIYFGKFNQQLYIQSEFCITEPTNKNLLYDKVYNYIVQNWYEVLQKKHYIFLLCPKKIVAEMQWIG